MQVFSDNSTISRVNSNINKKIFSLRKTNRTDVVVIKGNTHFSRTVAMRKTLHLELRTETEITLPYTNLCLIFRNVQSVMEAITLYGEL